ncbi:MAG: GNAT family N-acetyltransferase [Patescibacteria group bacterium]
MRSWQAIYRSHFPDGYLDNLSVEQRAATWRRILTDPSQMIAVYELPSGIVGFACIGPSRDADATLKTGELSSIYLDPNVWRQGIGTLLIRWAMAAAVSRSWDKMTLWVLKVNAQARTFYEQSGWLADGVTKSEPFGGGTMEEMRYEWCAA